MAAALLLPLALLSLLSLPMPWINVLRWPPQPQPTITTIIISRFETNENYKRIDGNSPRSGQCHDSTIDGRI